MSFGDDTLDPANYPQQTDTNLERAPSDDAKVPGDAHPDQGAPELNDPSGSLTRRRQAMSETTQQRIERTISEVQDPAARVILGTLFETAITNSAEIDEIFNVIIRMMRSA